MPRYNFADPASPVQTVTAISTLSGSKRAYLSLPADAAPEQYAKTIEAIRAAGLLTLPGEWEGRPALEVRGQRNNHQLLNILNEQKLTTGKSQSTPIPEDKHDPKDMLAARSLNWAGISYFLGDAALMTQGIMDKSMNEVYASLGYILGTQSLLWYGQDQTPTHLHDMAKDMLTHMHREGVDIPHESAAYAVAEDKDKTLPQKVDRFMRRFPSEVMGAGFFIAGAYILAAARKDYKGAVMSKLKLKDSLLGGVTMASGLLSMFVKERPHDPNKPEAHGLDKVIEWVQEKPLRIAGWGLMVSTAIHGISTAQALQGYQQKWKAGDISAKKDFFSKGFRGVFVVTNLIAELLISISSKGHAHGAKKADNGAETSAYELAADILSRQKPEDRAAAEEHLANFLCHRDVLALPKAEVVEGIRHHTQLLEKNPWALHAPAIAVPKDAYLTEDGRIDYNKPTLQHRLQDTFPDAPLPAAGSPGATVSAAGMPAAGAQTENGRPWAGRAGIAPKSSTAVPTAKPASFQERASTPSAEQGYAAALESGRASATPSLP